MKVCPACKGEPKPLTDFKFVTIRGKRYPQYCKDCNREKGRESMRKWYQENRYKHNEKRRKRAMLKRLVAGVKA